MKVSYLHNPGTLKIDLMLRGVRLPKDVEPLVFHGRAGEGVDLVLPGGSPVNVPCGEEFTKNSPYVLSRRKDRWFISDGTDEVEVKLVKRPEFLDRTTEEGTPYRDIATVHGSYVLVLPKKECVFFEKKVECSYCAGGYDEKTGRTYTVDEVVEVVSAVLDEGVSEIIYLSTGFTEEDDGGIGFLIPYIEAIKKRFNCLVAVEALPPKKNHWIDQTYAAGADALLYNLEIFDEELFEALCPGRARFIGRKRYMEALKYAASIFPNGTVASHLIVGLEPPGSTCMGIDFLTDMGVVPILPIYRPRPGGALRIEPLNAEVIIPIYRHLYRAVKKKGINMNWMRDISIVTTPIEGRLLTGDKSGGISGLIEKFYGTKLGIKTAWGLSTLRRKLRVKEIEEDS